MELYRSVYYYFSHLTARPVMAQLITKPCQVPPGWAALTMIGQEAQPRQIWDGLFTQGGCLPLLTIFIFSC